MSKVLFTILFFGSVICSATDFPSHVGMGSRLSTVGKISSYSGTGKGLWTGYWKPFGFTVSVNDHPQEPTFNDAWPNPTTGIFNTKHEGYVTVFSQEGTVVFKGNTNGSIDITNAASGVYFMRTEKGTTLKIIKY